MSILSSNAIFGIVIVVALSTVISIYTTSMTEQNQKLQGVSLPSAKGQPPSQVSTKLITTSQSNGNAQSGTSSITIAEGSADQQVKVYYQPNPAHVSSGSTVMWINKDTAPHTATSGLPSSAKDSGKIFDTGLIVPAAPANLVSFNGTGKYRDPEFTWIQKVVSTGLKFLTSNKLGDKYENDIFLGSFLNGKIYHFDLNKNRII